MSNCNAHCWQVGDTVELPIYFSDTFGQPMDPSTVTYALFKQGPNGEYFQVGCDQTPLHTGLGSYLAYGCDDVGCWLVRWKYVDDNGVLSSIDFYFSVSDKTSASDSSCCSW